MFFFLEKKNSPRIIKSSHRIQKTSAGLANDIFLWNANILKADAARVGALLAHVDLLATGRDALPFALDNETSEGL